MEEVLDEVLPQEQNCINKIEKFRVELGESSCDGCKRSFDRGKSIKTLRQIVLERITVKVWPGSGVLFKTKHATSSCDICRESFKQRKILKIHEKIDHAPADSS